MRRTGAICVSLLCLSSGAYAQDAADLSSIIFVPGVISDHVLPVSSPLADNDATADQASDDGSLDRLLDSAAQLERSITEKESQDGTRSSDLAGELTSLAAVYQELGDHLLAIGALERARQISRATDGLHSLNQAQLVEQMIDSMEVIGQFSESDALQDALLELALRNEEDARSPSIVAAVADRQMDIVDAYLEDGNWRRPRELLSAAEGSGWEPSTSKAGRHLAPAKLGRIRNSYDAAIEEALTSDDYELGDPLGLDAELADTYYLIDTVNDFLEEGRLPRRRPPEWDVLRPENDREWALQTLRRARRLYSSGMQAALKERNYAEYLGLEEQVLETYYFEMAHPELHPSYQYRGKPRRRSLKGIIYVTGASVLEAKVVDRLAQGAPAVDVALALIELADWHLLFSQNGTALGRYQDAHDFLVKEDVSGEIIAGLLAPEVPAVLPAFSSQSMQFDPARPYRGHLDVSIEIGKYGDSTRVEILDASSGASSDIEKRFRGHVAGTRFRPRFVEGQAARSDEFSIRYFFDY